MIYTAQNTLLYLSKFHLHVQAGRLCPRLSSALVCLRCCGIAGRLSRLLNNESKRGRGAESHCSGSCTAPLFSSSLKLGERKRASKKLILIRPRPCTTTTTSKQNSL